MRRRGHQPPLAVRIAPNVTKSTILSVFVFMAFGVIGGTGLGRPSTETAAPVRQDPQTARIERLMERHDCSTDGYGPGVIPGSALVLRADQVRYTTFDEGWAVFTGDQDGSLVAVCLDVHPDAAPPAYGTAVS